MRAVLDLGPSAGSCPFGQFEYRTAVSHPPRLRKRVYERGRSSYLVGFLQRLAEFFPFREECGVCGFMPVELFGVALALFRTDEILQRGFAPCDHGLGAADLRFQCANAVFHLLAFDGIQALSPSGRGLDGGVVAVFRRPPGRFNCFQLLSNGLILLRAAALFSP